MGECIGKWRTLRGAVCKLAAAGLLVFAGNTSQAQTWTGTYDVIEVSDGTACGFGHETYRYALDVRDHGRLISIHQPGTAKAALTGLVNAGRLQAQGSFDGSDGWKINAILQYQFANNGFTGSYAWTYSKAGQSCVDTSTYTATRRTAASAQLASPTLTVQQSGNQATARWTAVGGATSYTLYYAPYPSASPLVALDMGTARSITQTLPAGARYYLAVGANGGNASSPMSNLELLAMGSTTTPTNPDTSPKPAAVASVLLVPASGFSLRINETREIHALPQDSHGNELSGRTVQWSSSNSAVVSTSGSGTAVQLTARSAGTATITATSEGRSASVTVTVTGTSSVNKYEDVQSLRITNQQEYVVVMNWAKNQSLFLRAEGTLTVGGNLPASYIEGMKWTSSNPSVAVIVGDGIGASASVLYAGKGSTTITVTLGSKSARIVLGLGENVVPVTSVSFTPPYALRVGECTDLSGHVEDAGASSTEGRTLTWASSNVAVLSTSASTGTTIRVCGVAAGTATLTLSSGGRSASHPITVGAAGAFNGVLALPNPIDVLVGTTISAPLALSTDDASWYGRGTLQWTASNTGVLGVSGAPTAQPGSVYQVQLTGRTAGTSTLTVRADTKTATTQVNVVTQLPARRVQLDGGSNLYVGETHATTLKLYDWNGQLLSAQGRTVTYSSSDVNVATVGSTGIVTARGAGRTLVTATVDGLTSHGVNYEVLLTPARIEITPASASIAVNGTVQFTARLISTTGAVISGRTISWRSSNTSVGSVSTNGLMRGLSNGTTTITASWSGLSASAQVVVGSGSSGGGSGGGGGGSSPQPIVTTCSIAIPVTALDRGEDSGWLSANFGGKLLEVRLTLGSMNGGSAQNPLYQYNLSIRNRGTAPLTVSWGYSLDRSPPADTGYAATIQTGGSTGDFFFGAPDVNPVWILIKSDCGN